MSKAFQTVIRQIPLVDSSVLIAYFLNEQKSELLDEYVLYGGYFTTMILSEASNFVQQRRSTHALVKMMEELFAKDSIYLCLMDEQRLIDEATKILRVYADNKLSLTDCYTLAQAEHYGLKVVTHDARMASYKNVEVVVVPR